ncbi:MAG TPA: ATP-binding protein [Ktedonobacteraceae bacterium]|nr:ATP-binding protein [Ktedonobacteraceae bacterium]
MSNAVWGDPKPTSDEQYPLKLLKGLLQDMLKQVPAYGACLALYDEGINQMVVRLHLRRCDRGEGTDEHFLEQNNFMARSLRHNTNKLVERSPALPEIPKSPVIGEGCFENIYPSCEQALFPPGCTYALGQDLIGATWHQDRSYQISHEKYQALRTSSHQPLIQETISPGCYLTLPLKEPEQPYEDLDRKHPQSHSLGIIVLYQLIPEVSFQAQQCLIAQQQAERISLYLQNDRLRRLQFRTRDHIRHLQRISTTFPNTLKLSDLVDEIYRFIHNTVDVSSMLLTLYDRDTKKLYDIFAIDKGKRIEGLTERPVIIDPEDRPLWWRITQREKRTEPLPLDRAEMSEYWELLSGTWGDQTGAGTFLLIPMKMFTRVVGSLCITSKRSQAYSPLDILVLETLVQIVTVALENAKLYERPRLALKQSKRREESLAATISALQAISTVLNVNELLHKFVQIVANLAQTEMCSFFQLTSDQQELAAQAIFDRTGKWHAHDGAHNNGKEDHEELIRMIRLPFKGSMLDELVNEAFFYLDAVNIETIAQTSDENGAIFLRETDTQKLLVIPVRYQINDLVGIVAIHTSEPNRVFLPEEVSILMAISAQAAGAIRNAQLFEQIQDANAELQRMDKVKDEFIKTASHELRTPLSAISGYSSLLKKQSESEYLNPQQISKYANKIVGSTQQLKDLVDNMTQAARMGALEKNLEFPLVPSQLQAATEIATAMLNVNIDQLITVDVAADLWVSGDDLRLRQIITNLLDNAAKYSPPRGRILITARAARLSQMPENQVDYNILASGTDPEVVVVRVCDEGEGIAPEDSKKIFEKFVRAPRSLTTPVRGTGMGLFICLRFIEAMGGRLWLERSIPGKGSIFSFYLMRVPQPAETREQDEPEPDTQEKSTYSAPESISR